MKRSTITIYLIHLIAILFLAGVSSALQMSGGGGSLQLESANTWGLFSGTNSQTLNVYGTRTDSANYERLSIVSVAGSRIDLLSQAAGTGSARQLGFGRGGAADWILETDGKLRHAGITFSSLTTSSNGTLAYCSDCTIANPCAGLGTGAFAKRLNGVWVCN